MASLPSPSSKTNMDSCNFHANCVISSWCCWIHKLLKTKKLNQGIFKSPVYICSIFSCHCSCELNGECKGIHVHFSDRPLNRNLLQIMSECGRVLSSLQWWGIRINGMKMPTFSLKLKYKLVLDKWLEVRLKLHSPCLVCSTFKSFTGLISLKLWWPRHR